MELNLSTDSTLSTAGVGGRPGGLARRATWARQVGRILRWDMSQTAGATLRADGGAFFFVPIFEKKRASNHSVSGSAT